MISIWHLFWIIPLCATISATVGFMIAVVLSVNRNIDDEKY